jgi:hypothetical protein
VSNILKERVGLPVWDGDRVVDTKHFFPGQELTKEDLEDARQDEDEQAMLIEHNCFTDDELAEIQAQTTQVEEEQAFVSDPNEPLPTQEDR